MSHNPHRVKKLTAQEFHPNNAYLRIMREIFLKQEKLIRFPKPRLPVEEDTEFIKGVDLVHPRATTTLLRFQHRWKNHIITSRQGFNVVEHDRTRVINSELVKLGNLSTLGEFEREDIVTIENLRPLDF